MFLDEVKSLALRCKDMSKSICIMQYALAAIGAIVAIYIFFPYSKDSVEYLKIFNKVADDNTTEYLFHGWLKVGAVLRVPFLVVLLPLIFFTLLIKLKVFQRIGAHSIMNVFVVYIAIFYLLHECTQLRISCAMAFALWSCVAIMQRKWFYALLLCLIALGFHVTSVLLPIVFTACYYSKIIRRLSNLFLLVGFLIFLLKISIIGRFVYPLAEFFGGRYLSYTTTLVTKQNTSGLAFVYASLISILLIVLHFWGKCNSRVLPKAYSALLATCAYGCGLMFWLYETVAVASRLSDVLVILIVPLLAIVISNLGVNFRYLVITFLCVVFSARFVQLFVY